MYIGYELLDLDKSCFGRDYQQFLDDGKTRYNEDKSKVKTKIDSFVLRNGHLNGSKMQANWFPQISADVFISHSHKDEDLAIALSEWLFSNFGLDVFIDSCIWGYSDNLLKMIDNEYCLNPTGETYSYTKRNHSTSHVHMMLSTALSMMIDKVECILFLNTPNSITPEDAIVPTRDNPKTVSPWIYSEIAMTKLIKQKAINEYRVQRLTESFSEEGKLEKALTIEYAIDKEHLNLLTTNNLCDWAKQWNYKGQKYSNDYRQHALDKLYEITFFK